MGLSVRVVYCDCVQRSVCITQKKNKITFLFQELICDIAVRTRQYHDKSVGNAISTGTILSKGLSTASN